MPQFSSITTVNAPAWLIHLHSNFLGNVGFQQKIYFIDNPEAYSPTEIEQLRAKTNIILCDQNYWEEAGQRPARVPHRQIVNLSYARNKFKADWFLHLDIDEFPLFSLPVEKILQSVEPEVSEIRIQNVERVSLSSSGQWFEGVLRMPSTNKELIQKYYGSRAQFLGMGLANYFHGKSFVANRANISQNIHGAVASAPGREVIRLNLDLSQAMIMHYPMITPVQFLRRMSQNLDNVGAKFNHERRLYQYVRSQPDIEKAARRAMQMLHFCAVEEAEKLVSVGLCRRFPPLGRQLFQYSSPDPDHLSFEFAERSFGSVGRSA